MYHVSAQGVDERMINVHYYYYSIHKKLRYILPHKIVNVFAAIPPEIAKACVSHWSGLLVTLAPKSLKPVFHIGQGC